MFSLMITLGYVVSVILCASIAKSVTVIYYNFHFNIRKSYVHLFTLQLIGVLVYRYVPDMNELPSEKLSLKLLALLRSWLSGSN